MLIMLVGGSLGVACLLLASEIDSPSRPSRPSIDVLEQPCEVYYRRLPFSSEENKITIGRAEGGIPLILQVSLKLHWRQ